MFNKERAVKINAIVLLCLGVLDLFRGFMHTFNIKWASTNIAKMTQHPDALMMMGAFGISNFLTGFIYIFIALKAKDKSPYITGLIPLAYFTGSAGLRFSKITMQSEYNGQYMMFVYLSICVIASLYYFVCVIKEKK